MAQPEDHICAVIQVLMAEHGHGKGSLPREVLRRFASKNVDYDTIDESIDKAAKLPFVVEIRADEFHLKQNEELVDYLVEECDREPWKFKAYLKHVPPEVWYKHDVTPP